MWTRDDFCVFILSHARADNVITYKTLRNNNYTGEIYIIIDDEDPQKDKYHENYGDKIIEFSKDEIGKTFDLGDIRDDKKGVVIYARNFCFEAAKQKNKSYFLELDDDYKCFGKRYIERGKLKQDKITNLDKLFAITLDFYENIPKCKTICYSQGGDYIGGKNSYTIKKGITRKAMNTFFCSTQRPFSFVGRVNEDVNTYTTLGQRGELLMSVADVNIEQCETQQNSGGMTETYIDNGTYYKTIYSVMYSPSCVKIATMPTVSHTRVHHHVTWNNCVPLILNERYKKR